jgi:hypothetical protein
MAWITGKRVDNAALIHPDVPYYYYYYVIPAKAGIQFVCLRRFAPQTKIKGQSICAAGTAERNDRREALRFPALRFGRTKNNRGQE